MNLVSDEFPASMSGFLNEFAKPVFLILLDIIIAPEHISKFSKLMRAKNNSKN